MFTLATSGAGAMQSDGPREPTRAEVHAIESGAVEVDDLTMIAVTGTRAWPQWRAWVLPITRGDADGQ